MPNPGAGTERTASELEWLRVYDYLRRNRYELAVRAADGYQAGARVAGTPLLAAPEWLPGTPIPLDRVRISLEPEAPRPRITATDIKALAPALLPERPGGAPYRRHSDVIGELAAPAVFENRVTYRLTGVDLAGEDPHLGFTLGRFFDGIDVGGAAAHEYAAAELDRGKGRPLRAAVKDPCDLAARPHAMAVGALTLRHDRAAETASFPLHWRDPRRVGHAGGMFQVIPVGIFQPSGEAEWNVATDFSLWRGLLREYAEELLGADEDHGSETAPIDYESWPLARRMTRGLADGRIRAWCLGLGADPLTFAMDLLTVVVIDAPLYDELFGAAVTDNAEGTVLPLRPFDAPTVRELLGSHPVQAAGAALLTLALGHRDTLLAGLPAALAPFRQVRALGRGRDVPGWSPAQLSAAIVMPFSRSSGDHDNQYDYVVVGGGTAGSVMASRLSEDPDVRVLLAEAGPAEGPERMSVPAAWRTLVGSEIDWAFKSIPQQGLDGAVVPYPRGKVLGGTSAINAMINLRGHRSAIDAWAAGGAVGRGYDDLLPYYRRSEHTEGLDPKYRGADGPMRPKPAAIVHPAARACFPGQNGFSFSYALLTPHSRGSVRLMSADPATDPAIDPALLADDRDEAGLLAGLRAARDLAGSKAMQPWRKAELLPGPDVADTGHLRSSGSVGPYFHPVGTCKMGTDASSVTDLQLRVRGIDRLRVVDASVMPSLPAANTNATVLAVAEQAADIIKTQS